MLRLILVDKDDVNVRGAAEDEVELFIGKRTGQVRGVEFLVVVGVFLRGLSGDLDQ